MKKMGIFLAYSADEPMKDQGIGRLLLFLLRSLLKREDIQLTVAMPAWYKEIFIEFLSHEKIDYSKLELLTTSHIPAYLTLKKYFSKSPLKPVQKKIFWLKKWINREKCQQLFLYWLSLSPLYFILFGLVLAIPMILLLPALLLLLMMFGSIFFIKKVASPFLKRARRFLIRARKAIGRRMKGMIHLEMRRHELNRLVARINKRKDITLWFAPTVFWPEISAIEVKKMFAAPDIVLVDFPTLFPVNYSAQVFPQIKESLRTADHVICYSDYVKQKHLMETLNIASKKISVIKHGAMDLSAYLQERHCPSEPRVQKIAFRNKSLQILRRFQLEYLHANAYLADFDFTHMRYIFYSSQIRPHKNVLSLVKVYETLLRKRFLNIKLVITGSLSSAPAIEQYIKKNRLQYDILSLSEVPSEVLAALNHLAICAVNPTLFEGGFPFTFTEAYSVGTPSVMSAIPVVKQEIESKELQEAMLFNPYHEEDMADKIEWAVQHKEQLYTMQAPLYQKFQQRTWDKVSQEYLALFEQQMA